MEPRTTSARTEHTPSLDQILWKMKHTQVLLHFPSWLRRAFPRSRLTSIDYAIALAILTSCFLSFIQPDLETLGTSSLNYLFGNPLEFYDNAGYATYPPSLYAVFAVWLYPWKLLGVITGPNFLPPYLLYWLKLATTITYLTTSYTFHLIAKEYFPDDSRAKYATAVWFTAPLAVFSQFIFSQIDIFYVQLMLLGYLMFLRNRLGWASLFFGLAVTFKSFPALCFFPLLFLLEKRLIRIAGLVFVFAAPTLLMRTIYSHSLTAFSANELNQLFLERVYTVAISTTDDRFWVNGWNGWWRIYLLPLAYAILCGITFFRRSPSETRIQECAYVWLTSCALIFVAFYWHPQWLIFPVPAMVLTSMLSNRLKSFLALDLLGMALFVAVVSLTYPDAADAIMFRGDLLKVDFHNSYLMAGLFNWFGDHSKNVFLTGFSAYLLLQIVLKYRWVFHGPHVIDTEDLDYTDIRQRLYIGLSIFLIPAVFVIWKDLTGREIIVQNATYNLEYPLVAEIPVEQTFIAAGTAIKSISLLIKTSGKRTTDDLIVELVDASGNFLARAKLRALATNEVSWHSFLFGSAIAVQKGSHYSFRVLSATGSPGNAFSLQASTEHVYKLGHAIVESRPQDTDLAFRIEFFR